MGRSQSWGPGGWINHPTKVTAALTAWRASAESSDGGPAVFEKEGDVSYDWRLLLMVAVIIIFAIIGFIVAVRKAIECVSRSCCFGPRAKARLTQVGYIDPDGKIYHNDRRCGGMNLNLKTGDIAETEWHNKVSSFRLCKFCAIHSGSKNSWESDSEIIYITGGTIRKVKQK